MRTTTEKQVATPKESIPEPKSKTDPVIEKIKNCKSRKELDSLWGTLSEKEQPNYIKNFQEKGTEYPKIKNK
jgi:hypothetical protein